MAHQQQLKVVTHKLRKQMSGKLMGRVYALKLTRVQRDVLQAICDHAKDDGTGAYPGVAYLAWKCDLSERQIKRLLKQLEGMKLIERVAYAKGGRGRTPRYNINLSAGTLKPSFQTRAKGDTHMSPFIAAKDDTKTTLFPSANGDNLGGDRMTSQKLKGDIASQKGDIQMSPQPSESRKRKPSTETHTRGLRRAEGVSVNRDARSRFSLDQCEELAMHLCRTEQGINNPGAFALKIYRSGELDGKIEAFLKGTLPPSVVARPTFGARAERQARNVRGALAITQRLRESAAEDLRDGSRHPVAPSDLPEEDSLSGFKGSLE